MKKHIFIFLCSLSFYIYPMRFNPLWMDFPPPSSNLHPETAPNTYRDSLKQRVYSATSTPTSQTINNGIKTSSRQEYNQAVGVCLALQSPNNSQA